MFFARKLLSCILIMALTTALFTSVTYASTISNLTISVNGGTLTNNQTLHYNGDSFDLSVSARINAACTAQLYINGSNVDTKGFTGSGDYLYSQTISSPLGSYIIELDANGEKTIFTFNAYHDTSAMVGSTYVYSSKSIVVYKIDGSPLSNPRDKSNGTTTLNFPDGVMDKNDLANMFSENQIQDGQYHILYGYVIVNVYQVANGNMMYIGTYSCYDGRFLSGTQPYKKLTDIGWGWSSSTLDDFASRASWSGSYKAPIPKTYLPIKVTTTLSNDTFTFNSGETVKQLNVTVTNHLLDDDVYPGQKDYYYTRDDVEGWWIRLHCDKFNGNDPLFWVPNSSTNATNRAACVFPVTINSTQVVNGEKVNFEGVSTIKYKNAHLDSDSDMKSATFYIPGDTTRTTVVPAPSIYITAPSSANVGENFTVTLNTGIPAGETITSLTLTSTFTDAATGAVTTTTKNITGNTDTQSYPGRGTVTNQATVTISNGKTATSNVVTTDILKTVPNVTLKAVIKVPKEPQHEGYPFYVSNETLIEGRRWNSWLMDASHQDYDLDVSWDTKSLQNIGDVQILSSDQYGATIVVKKLNTPYSPGILEGILSVELVLK